MEEIKNYKQFYEDLSTGKNLLLDYNNNQIECTKLGTLKPNYSRNITGQYTFQARLQKGLIHKIKYELPKHYIPFSNRLIGSLMYPRPLSIPFSNSENNNSNNYNNKENSKEKILEEIKNNEDMFKIEKNKQYFLNGINKNGIPNFLCVKLGMECNKERKKLIGLIENEIDNRKKKYRYEPKYYKKDGIYRGLIQHKKEFENNMTKNIYNGEKIPHTKQKDINNKFHVIKKLIIKNGVNRMHIKNEEINKEEYNKLYRIKKIQEMTSKNFFNNINLDYSNIKNKNNNSRIKHSLSVPRNNNIYENDVNNNKKRRKQNIEKIQTNNLDITTQNQNNIKNNTSTFNKSIKFNSTVTTCYNYNITNNNESKFSNSRISKNEIYSPKSLPALKRSLSDFQPHTNINNGGENDYIMIFNDFNTNTMNENKKIRNLKEMKKNYEHEIELIKGYQMSFKEELNIEPKKYKSPNYISPADVYQKELEMFIKVNPIEHEKEMRRKLFDDKMLRKKLENKKIFERIRIKK